MKLAKKRAIQPPPASASAGRGFKEGDQVAAQYQQGPDWFGGVIEKARADGRPLLQPVASVTELRDWFNNRQLGSYDGVAWRCWIARGDEVRAVEVTAKRLLW